MRIGVADTGVGMSEATRAKAMEPFFTTKGIGKGTGLGLSMVHGLTAQSGGAMHITSKQGNGTVVNLWLPRARREDVRRGRTGRGGLPQDGSRGSRILLVDDDSLVSMNTAYMLMDLGHSVMEAPSGAHALRVLETDSQFDVVITDYAMPGMTGLDLANKIKEVLPASSDNHRDRLCRIATPRDPRLSPIEQTLYAGTTGGSVTEFRAHPPGD